MTTNANTNSPAITVFNNETFGKLRSVLIDGEPWFVGKDVADILGYQNGSRDINRHVDEEDRRKVMVFDGNQNKETTIINESGLYSLILSSKLPSAKKFKHWVTSEVLPSLRKTGKNTVVIGNTSLSIKEYAGKRVVTFKDIDMVHNRPEGTARKRFNDNKRHMIEGEDFFVRKTDEAKKEFGITAPNGLTLLTESGYLMLVKSFTDDLAWQVQKKLVNSYFRLKEVARQNFHDNVIDESLTNRSDENLPYNQFLNTLTDMFNCATEKAYYAYLNFLPSTNNENIPSITSTVSSSSPKDPLSPEEWKKDTYKKLVKKSASTPYVGKVILSEIYKRMLTENGIDLNNYKIAMNIPQESTFNVIADNNYLRNVFEHQMEKFFENPVIINEKKEDVISIPGFKKISHHPPKVPDMIWDTVAPLGTERKVATLHRVYKKMREISGLNLQQIKDGYNLENKTTATMGYIISKDPKLLEIFRTTTNTLFNENKEENRCQIS